MKLLNYHRTQLKLLKKKLNVLDEQNNDYYFEKLITTVVCKINLFFKEAFLLAETLKGLINRLLLG